MTDPMTPLTDESEALLASASYTEGPGKDTLREALYRIEAAAARRALEGSGVVSVEVVAPAINGMLSTGWLMDSLTEPVGWEGKPNPHQWLYDAIIAAGKAVDAALPRPEEPRMERCAAGVHAVHAGIPTVVTCGEPRDSETHEQGAPDYDHPFTPEDR